MLNEIQTVYVKSVIYYQCGLTVSAGASRQHSVTSGNSGISMIFLKNSMSLARSKNFVNLKHRRGGVSASEQ